MRPLRIAQVTPLYEAVPPRLYGGTERVVAHLTNALVDLGHEVILFASADARTKARLAPVRDQAIRLDPAPLKSDFAAHLSMMTEVRRRAGQFDVIHFHTDMIHFPFFEDMAERTLTTLHGRLDLKELMPFDAVMLGMGDDGHVASLIPGSPVMAHAMGPVLTAESPQGFGSPPIPRISLTFAALLQSRAIFLLIAGEAKRQVIARAESGEDLPVRTLLTQDRVPVRILWAPNFEG